MYSFFNLVSETFYIILFTLLFVGFTDTENNCLKKYHRVLLFVALLGIILLIWTALYLSFTPVGFNTINGVQPRYFIPFIFPLMICIQSKDIQNKINERKYNSIIFVVMSFAVLLSIFELILKSYCY